MGCYQYTCNVDYSDY